MLSVIFTARLSPRHQLPREFALDKAGWELFQGGEGRPPLAEDPICYLFLDKARIHLQHDFLRLASLVDTPGLGSVTDRHDEITETYLRGRSGLIVKMDHQWERREMWRLVHLIRALPEERTRGLRSDLSRLGGELREEIQDKHGKLERRQEAAAAEQKKLLESILRQTEDARKQLQALPGVISAQEKKLTGKQDSLRDGLGALQKELPEQFHNRRELGEILNRMITEQRSLFQQSARTMQRQIRIAQVLGGLAALLSLIAWLATRT